MHIQKFTLRQSVKSAIKNNTHISRALILLCVMTKRVLARIGDILELFSEELRYSKPQKHHLMTLRYLIKLSLKRSCRYCGIPR